MQAASAHKQLLTACISSCSLTKLVATYFLLLLLFSKQAASGGNIIEYLPGYDGKLPFKLETGYISVDDSELFYYFVESEGNPRKDPLVLWLTGGPGCTSFSGLVNEVGPLEYEVETYDGGLPKLKYHPYGRTKVTSMLFLDSPVGSGFSYSRTHEGWFSSDTKSIDQCNKFLRKWLEEHPKYRFHRVFLGGSSYSGITIPLLTKKIVDGNNDKEWPYVNIKGYFIGSPVTGGDAESNSKVDFAYGMALIDKDIYERVKRRCNENYVQVDPANTECKSVLTVVFENLVYLDNSHILKPNCDGLDPRLRMHHRYLQEGINDLQVFPKMESNPWCKFKAVTEGNAWGNNETVKEALHVRKGTKPRWKRCNGTLVYEKNVRNVLDIYKELSRLGLKLLIESGDHDMTITHVATLKWIKSLNLSVIDAWRPWFVDDQVAGYTINYAEGEFRLIFASLKGAGHPVSVYSRRESHDLFDRWINDLPL